MAPINNDCCVAHGVLANRSMRTLLALLVATSVAAADPTPISVNGQLTDLYTGFDVAGADVFIAGPHGLQTTVQTDATGHYLASVDGPGTYYLTFATEGRRLGFKVEVGARGSTHFDAKIDRGEIIEIHDLPKKLPPVMPKLPHRRLAIPAYSDSMMEQDTWVKAWMLLDVDETGTVARAKFLDRPGHDLDQIAVDHVLGLKFSPALDGLRQPIRTLVIFPVEWPAYWWMNAVGSGFALRMPEAEQLVHIPCAGSGPLNLDSVHPVYRDCRRPNLSNLEREPWYALPRIAGTATH